MIFIKPQYRDLFGEKTVAGFLAIQGEVRKQLQNRRTLRFERGGQAYFLKAHRGPGWREILKNLVLLRLPVVSARNEWRAIQSLETLGLATTPAVGYGEEGRNPARRESFLLTQAVEDTQDLEHWAASTGHEPGDRSWLTCKRTFLRRLAALTRRMHAGGVNHRDFYLCHLRVDTRQGEPCNRADSADIYIMDLHRAQLRRRTPLRWAAKDIAGLMFSAVHGPAGVTLTVADYARFMKAYTGGSLAEAISGNRRLWRAVVRRYCRDYYRQYRQPPRLAKFLRDAR